MIQTTDNLCTKNAKTYGQKAPSFENFSIYIVSGVLDVVGTIKRSHPRQSEPSRYWLNEPALALRLNTVGLTAQPLTCSFAQA